MPIQVKVLDNVGVWYVREPISLADINKAFEETASVRDNYPKTARLLLAWTAKVPQPVREEITNMHAMTAEIFQRIVAFGPSTVLASITTRAMLSGKYNLGIEGTTSLKQALDYVAEGLPPTLKSKISKLESEIRAFAPNDF